MASTVAVCPVKAWLFKRTLAFPEAKFVMVISSLPSPFRSPKAIESGPSPSAKVTSAAKVPLPLPKSTLTLLTAKFAVMMSSLPAVHIAHDHSAWVRSRGESGLSLEGYRQTIHKRSTNWGSVYDIKPMRDVDLAHFFGMKTTSGGFDTPLVDSSGTNPPHPPLVTVTERVKAAMADGCKDEDAILHWFADRKLELARTECRRTLRRLSG